MSVHFGTLDTYNDLGLQLVDEDLGFPSLQRSTVEVTGRDGTIDLTGMIDTNPHFGNRTAKWKFAMIHGQTPYWYSVVTELMSRLHGRTLDIVTDSEPEFTMHGCVQIKSFAKFQSPGYVEIEADCQPYRAMFGGVSADNWMWDPFSFVNGVTYQRTFTGETVVLDGTLYNAGSKTMPVTFTATTAGTLIYRGESFSLGAGDSTPSGRFYIEPGEETFRFLFASELGTVTATYGMEAL